ncbi:MAG TPA: ABC transporter ATP-binding protein [Bacilli bacterium]|nr:ABC transporter ATP-binding protein [Bacilli bacterium]
MKKRIYYFRKIYLVVFALLINAYLAYRMSFAMKDVIDYALALEWDSFFQASTTLIILVLIIFPANLLYSYVKNYFIKDAVTKMKTDYIQAVFHKNINEFQKDNNALYVSALTNDFNLIEKDYIEQIVGFVEGFIQFATAIFIIVLISPILLLIGIGVIIINVIISNLASKPIKKHNEERSVLFSDYSGFIKEVLSAFNIIKTNGLEDRVRSNYIEKSTTVQQKKYVIDKIMSFIFAAQNINFSITFLGLMLLVAYLTIVGTVTFSGVVVITNNIDRLIGPIAHLSEAIPRIISVKAIFKRIDETLLNKNTHVETESFDGLKQALTFQNVSFAYDDNVVLKDVNISFEKGKKYLVIGPSGGGKSTVLRLLRKYFNPSSGDVYLDHANLKDVKKQDYFSKIANIEQLVFLFEDSIRNNLTLYKDYTEEEINVAIEKAGLKDFVDSHPEGLDYMIYDNGKNISGGEKSRIAIARGLLNKADILLLDEAFASLDRARVKEIEQSLLALTNVTIINVSHVIIEENKPLYDHIMTVKNKTILVS